MRVVAFAAAFLTSLADPVCAADAVPATPLPEGWTQASDGTYTHTESKIACPKTVGTYEFVRLDGPSAPNLLGVCIYSGGAVRVGEIRVRKFIDGVGETPLAIQNDRSLMGAGPSDAPAGSKLVSAMRLGPGPEIDGNATSQYVMTSVVGGLLKDCISQTKRDKGEFDDANAKFTHACMFDH